MEGDAGLWDSRGTGAAAFEKRMWIIPAYTRTFVGGCFPHAARADKSQF